MDGKSVKEFPEVIKGPAVDYSLVLQEDTFRHGQQVVREGHHGNWVWVILEGTAVITRKTAHGPVNIVRLGEGSFIGTTTAFVQRENIRSATVTAEGVLHLGLLDTGALYDEYKSLSHSFRGLLLSMAGRLKGISDRVVEWFPGMIGVPDLPKGKRLELQKTPANSGTYFITEGEACILAQTKTGVIPLVNLGKGDAFGWLPFPDRREDPECIRLLVSDGLKVRKIYESRIQKEYDQLSRTLKNLFGNMDACESATTDFVCALCNG